MLYLKKEDALMTDAVQFALTELEKILGKETAVSLELRQDSSIEEQSYTLDVSGEVLQLPGVMKQELCMGFWIWRRK